MKSKEINIPAVDAYLFWDVDQYQMDWQSHSAARWILTRVVERGGNETDFKALVDFYGFELLRQIGRELTDLRFSFMCQKLSELLDLNPSEMKCYIEQPSRTERLISMWS